MKAVQINTYGGIDVLEINENAPKPAPSKNQILVEVYAASINPIDWKIRAGHLSKMPLEFPIRLGGDFAGVITEVGEDGQPAGGDLKIGDEVYGSAIVLNGGSGSFAQFLVANSKNTARKPKSANFEEAAALPLVGTSAVQAIEEHIKLSSGQRILIHGGTGGIGHVAIQLAKSKGAYIATTVSAKDMDFVKNLGADQVIDYETQVFEDILKDIDSVFDTVGGEVTDKSFKVLKKGGTLVSMLGQPSQELAQKHPVTAIGQNTVTNTQHLSRLAELVGSGKITVHIDKVFPLEQVKEAFRHLEEGHPQGKVVLKIKDSD